MNMLDQIAWEKDLSKRGVLRYNENQVRLKTSGEADQCDGVKYLLKDRLLEVAELLKQHSTVGKGRGVKYNKLLRKVTQTEEDLRKVAFLGVQAAFQCVHKGSVNTFVRLSTTIGKRIEVDLKCRMFEAMYPAYYRAVEKSMKEQNVKDYAHKQKVYMTMFQKFEDLEWEDLGAEVHSHLGIRVLDCVLHVFKDIIVKRKVLEHRKHVYRMFTTPAFDEWITTFENARALMNPMTMPCKIPPQAWNEDGVGGYYTPELKAALPFIKTKSRDHRKFVRQHNPQQHRKAINAMQRTPWKVNEEVLKVQQEVYLKGLGIGIPNNTKVAIPEFPEHLKPIAKEDLTVEQKEEVIQWKVSAKAAHRREKDRQSQVVGFMQSYKTAQELRKWEEFYYVYTCDFRGRIYCATTGLSPQGADIAKGILKFARSEKLGVDGVKWLAIQGANTFGKDKISYEDRVRWIASVEEHISATVEDPIGSREWWGSADKPYQFLAFCFEWSRCDYGRDRSASSSIPVGLDGSCNGLQHFSAMLKDSVGAKATNLLPSDKPEDIYQEVADRCTLLLQRVDDPMARKWLQVGLTRKLAKRPVMTLPYGATQTSAREYIFDWCTENWDKFNVDEKYMWEYTKFLTPYLWKAIGTTVIAATQAMAWLKKNVGSTYCSWLTPIGFPVYQFYKDVPIYRVVTKLCGGVNLQLKIADYDCYGEPKRSQQKNGIAPNLVHSIDSTHMVKTVNATDLTCYAMIHDDFGTQAGSTETLFKAIRRTFLSMYKDSNPLEEWGLQVEANMDTLPETGDYDVNAILASKYFFG